MVIPFFAPSKPASSRRLALWRFPGQVQELGRLTVFDGFTPIFDCVTIQRAIGYKDGCYSIKPYFSPNKQKWVLLIDGIEGHSGIEFHVGNTVKDSLGCSCPGKEFQDINGDGLLDVIFSTATMERLLALITQSTTIQIQTING